MSRVADDLYKIAHEDRSGRLSVAQGPVGLALASALLTELVLADQLRVRDGGLHPGSAEQGPPDRLSAEILASVLAPAYSRDVGRWLQFLAVEARADVRQRLLADGQVRKVMYRRGLGRARARYVPTNPNDAIWPSIRLAKHLSGGLRMSPGDQVLAVLVEMTGLLDHVLWLKPDHAAGFARVAQIRHGLVGELAELMAHTAAAIGDQVLTEVR